MGATTSDLGDPGDLPRVRYVQPSKDEAGNSLTWNFVKKLRVSHESPENPIEFHQIEICGVDGINYALKEHGGTATQSSNEYPPDKPWGHAFCVIDGDRYGYFNRTACVPNGWLDVTLSEPRWIESFAIFNSGFDMCVYANGHLVQLLDQENQVVYEHRISISEDLCLFDPNQQCALKFINEESKVVTLKLTLASSDIATKVKVLASYSLSGRPLNPFELSIAEPEAVQNLCQTIYAATGIVTHQQRLLLEDGQILRMRSGTWEPQGSLHEICPSLLRLLSAEKKCQDSQDLDLGS
eukprot:s896_g9.t1